MSIKQDEVRVERRMKATVDSVSSMRSDCETLTGSEETYWSNN